MRSFRMLLGLFVALVTTPAFADEIRGTLIRVSPDKQEVAVDIRDRGRRSATMTLRTDGETQIMLGRKAGKLTDLTPGKRVRVLYEVQNGQPIVRSIIAPGVITLNPALLETLGGIAASNGVDLGGLLNPSRNPPAAGSPPATPMAPAVSVPNGIGGILRRVSRTDRELVILGDPGPGKPPSETTVFVPNEARIIRNQRAITLDDLREGEAVVVAAQPKDGRLEAQSVTIGQPGPAVAGPATAPLPVQQMSQDSKIARIREALKLLDGILEQIDAQRGPRQ
jgi:hypothetical protein